MNQIPNIEETHNTREVEEVVYSLFVEHIEDLMNEAEMAVRYEVKDKEEYYERLRTGSRKLVDAIRTTLHHQLQKAREEVYKEVQANAEQCYRDNGRGAFEPVKAVPLNKLFTN